MSDPSQRFTGLYDEYYRRVLRYALQHADPGGAEDVASETFLIAWRRLAEIPQPPLPWLLGVARNLLRQQFGRARRQRPLADRMAALTSDADLQAWDAGEHVVERAAALDALGSLNDADVEALTLVTWHGLSAAEAAEVVGCSPHAVTAGAGVAAAAVAAAMLIASPVHGHPAQGPAGASGVSAGGVPGGGVPGGGADSSHAVLLTAAHVAAAQPAATGTYWYVKERDFEPAAAVVSAGKSRPKGGKAARKDPGYGASFAATQETWTGASRTRTIVNENLVYGFASAAGKKKWEAAGSPKLANPAGGSGGTGPVTSNYPFGGYSYNIGAIKVDLATAGKLPTTPGKLGELLHGAWQGLTEQQRAATVGLADPSYAQYLFQVAGALLTGPVTPGTRSAVFGLLARQAGLTVAANVTDPLGRTGTAIGDVAGDFLIISPSTAQVLDLTTCPVRTGSTISGKLDGTEAYLSMGWTDKLGTPAGS